MGATGPFCEQVCRSVSHCTKKLRHHPTTGISSCGAARGSMVWIKLLYKRKAFHDIIRKLCWISWRGRENRGAPPKLMYVHCAKHAKAGIVLVSKDTHQPDELSSKREKHS